MATGDRSTPIDSGNVFPKDQLSAQIQQDIEYSRKFWGQPGRTAQEFLTMFEELETGVRIKSITINADPRTEEGKQILAAYKRLGHAMGLNVGEFKRMAAQSGAKVLEGDPSLHQVQQRAQDREFANLYWKKYTSSNWESDFQSFRSGIEDASHSGLLYKYIGLDAQGALSEKSKAMLSAKRVLARALGFSVG